MSSAARRQRTPRQAPRPRSATRHGTTVRPPGPAATHQRGPMQPAWSQGGLVAWPRREPTTTTDRRVAAPRPRPGEAPRQSGRLTARQQDAQQPLRWALASAQAVVKASPRREAGPPCRSHPGPRLRRRCNHRPKMTRRHPPMPGASRAWQAGPLLEMCGASPRRHGRAIGEHAPESGAATSARWDCVYSARHCRKARELAHGDETVGSVVVGPGLGRPTTILALPARLGQHLCVPRQHGG